MGKNITQISTTTTATDGSLMYIAIPDGVNPYGFVDKAILKSNYLKEVTSNITTIENNITAIESDITTINNLFNKTRYSSRTASFSFQQEANSVISDIYFFGSGTVKVGITSGGDQILSERTITNNYRGAEALSQYTLLARNIYIGVVGGPIDIVIIKKLNLNS